MLNFKNTFFLILLTSIQILSAKPEPEYTKFSILGGIYGNYNIHSSSFKELPGYTSCCTEFTGGNGMGITLSIGAEYLIDKEIFSGLSYRFVLSYSNRSALLSQEEVIGYDIAGNEYSEIIVDFAIDNVQSVLLTEHLASIYILDDIPLNLLLGFQLGFPISGTFEQHEELLQPQDRFFENGEKFRNRQSGDVPDVSSIYFGLSAGAAYDVYQNSGLTISPEVKFTYGLTDYVSSLDWKVSSFSAGITAKYNFPVSQPEVIKPADPPKPVLPEPPPPVEPVLSIELAAFYNGNKLSKNNPTVHEITQVNSIKQINIAGVLFFDESENISDKASLQNILKSLKNNNISEIELKSYSSSTESAQKQVDHLKNFSEQNNINVGSTNIASIDTNSMKHPELKEESNKVEILIAGQVYSAVLFDTTNVSYNIPDANIIAEAKINSNYDISSEKGIIEFNGETLNEFENKASINLSGNKINRGKNLLKIQYEAENTEINSNVAEEFQLITRVTDEKDNYEYELQNGAEKASILALSNFDRSSFYSINKGLLKKAIDQLESDPQSRITLIPSTDNLGEKEYNTELSQKRAQNALALFDKQYHSRIDILLEKDSFYDNNTPIGRVKNRSVLIIFN